jgi:hypothetical protein
MAAGELDGVVVPAGGAEGLRNQLVLAGITTTPYEAPLGLGTSRVLLPLNQSALRDRLVGLI